MIDLKNYRIVDLNVSLHPGIKYIDGEYTHSTQNRRLELRQFIYKHDRCPMFWVDTETHVGTHVEGPTHYSQQAKSVAELPIETYMGESLVVNLNHLEPKNNKPQPIKQNDLIKVRKRDIVLMWSSFNTNSPYISPEAAIFLKEKEVKMIGLQDIGLEVPVLKPHDRWFSHETLLGNNIPIIENLINLEKLKRERVFYIGLPIKIMGLDSSWIRAIALEEL